MMVRFASGQYRNHDCRRHRSKERKKKLDSTRSRPHWIFQMRNCWLANFIYTSPDMSTFVCIHSLTAYNYTLMSYSYLAPISVNIKKKFSLLYLLFKSPGHRAGEIVFTSNYHCTLTYANVFIFLLTVS